MGKIIPIGTVLFGVFFFFGALLTVRVLAPVLFTSLDLFDSGFVKTFTTGLVYLVLVFAIIYVPILVFTRDSREGSN